MKTQVVYALKASKNDFFIEEMWASIYSLRLYEPNREVRVVCDSNTCSLIKQNEELLQLITEVIPVEVPSLFNNAKLISRQLKTTIRDFIKGRFLFVDTDTIFCGTLEYIDNLSCDIAATLEYHLPLSFSPFKQNVYRIMGSVFGIDIVQNDYWFNSGVLFVNDTDLTYEFYKRWNNNWKYSAFEKDMSQDQPGFMKTNIDLENIVCELPGIYNCQPAMSVKHFADARIIHFLHMFFPRNRSFSPFMDKSIYKQIHVDGGITDITAVIIKDVKSSFSSPSCIVGEDTLRFLSSPIEPIFERIYKDGGPASFLMIKVARFLQVLHDFLKKINICGE